MKSIIENLLALQNLTRPGRPAATEQEAALRRLRQKVPAPILAHYDRLVACGRSGVALVRHGVCGGCHMKVPIGTAASLAKPHDLYLCENCGCYLALAPDESADETPAHITVRKTRRTPLAVEV
jgi:predicted  nucleic acid-binding Zn-ribbon protein